MSFESIDHDDDDMPAGPSLKQRLLAKRAGVKTEDVEIPGVGKVTVRGLTRKEMLLASQKYPDDDIAKERFNLSIAMVNPRMTMDDVNTWQENSEPNEINTVAMKINELSGIGKGAAKSDVPAVREQS